MNPGDLTSGASFASLGLPPDVSKSPSSSGFLGDEEAASTCPLLTPSPPVYEQRLSSPEPGIESDVQFVIGDEENTIYSSDQPLKSEDIVTVDSTSSGSSNHDPTACIQLLPVHPHPHYQTLATGLAERQENGVNNVVPLTFEQYPVEYYFTTWNWVAIRRYCSWLVISAIVALFCVAVALIFNLPSSCDPDHMWWQSATVYEIFPASFQDSDNDGVGDLIGLSSQIGYLYSLGVTAIRLNSIFKSEHYPEGYDSPTNLKEIDQRLGTFKNFQLMLHNLHHNNISLILDLPIVPVLNDTDKLHDPILDAMSYWITNKVDGFYIVGAEQEDIDSRAELWRKVLGPGRLLVSPPGVRCDLCNLEHLVLNVSASLEQQLEEAGSAKGLWSMSKNQRLADGFHTGPIGALLFLMALPGTPSLMYGDELGLQDIHNISHEHPELQHMKQLAPMVWDKKGFTGPGVLPWIPTSVAVLKDQNERESARAALQAMSKLRLNLPQFYISGPTKVQSEDTNFAVRYSDKGLIVVERWYPRRHVYVAVANFSPNKVERDLSTLYYGGNIVVSYPPILPFENYILFRKLSIMPGQTFIVELDK